jgi:hypothetical protein
MKPSIKNKLSADRIEEANRLLNEIKPTEEAVKTVVSTPKVVETVENAQNTEGVSNVGIEMSVVGNTPKSVTQPSKSVKTVAKAAEKPSRRSKIAIQAEEENLRLVRVTIDIPEDLHEKMKIKMILTRQTMKDYLLDFIRKDVGNANFGYK